MVGGGELSQVEARAERGGQLTDATKHPKQSRVDEHFRLPELQVTKSRSKSFNH